MKEIWKDIEGHEGLYQVSNLGRVRSLDKYRNGRNGAKVYCRGRILKPFKSGTANYLSIALGREKKEYIHRLVAISFIQNPLNKKEVDHINCDITDNTVDNLRWVTRKENLNNPITKKRNSASRKGWYQPKGKENNKSKTVYQMLNDKIVAEFGSTMEAQRETHIDNTSIGRCCNGKQKIAGGYRWKYKEGI